MTEVVLAGDAETRAWIGTPERRDPSAATLPTQWQGPKQVMQPDWNAEQALRLAYYANVFAFAGVRAIATDLSALPIRIGDPETGDYDPNHPMAAHFSPPPKGPNPVTSARKLIAWSIAQRIVTGRIGWEIELGAGTRPVAYWPLTSRYLDAIASQGGARYFDGFEYGPPNKKRKLNPDRVFYDWNPAADDWRQPESAFQAARLDLSVAVRQDIYDDAFLRNNAQPASLVVHERFAQPDERDAFREQFTARHQGEGNAGRTAFVEAEGGDGNLAGAIHIEALGLSQRDGEFIARYDQKIRGILIALGVPMSRLGSAKGETFSNAGQEWSNYWRGTLLPIALDFADAMNIQLLDRYGKHNGVAYFDTSGVAALQESAQYAQADVTKLVESGVLIRDEARAIYGEGPHPDPEVGQSSGPLNVAPPMTVNVNPPAAPPVLPAAASAESEEQRALRGEVRRTNLYRAAAATIAILERRWTRALDTMFQAQARATIARLEGKRGRQMRAPDAGAIYDPAFYTASTEDIAAGLYESVFALGGARLAEKFGIDFGLDSPGVNEAILRRSKQLAGQVTDTTYRSIQEALAAGTDAGEGIPALADRIRAVFAYASDKRATTIARTEVVSSYNASGSLIANTLGTDVVAGQEWIAARDDRTRDDHAEADGQVVGIDEPFDVGGEELAYPGDEAGSAGNVINCRCTTAFLTPDEMDSPE